MILLAAHRSLAQLGSGESGHTVVPARQNPLVISGVGQECPDTVTLDGVAMTVEAETEELLAGVVGQIECTYLGNC